MDSTEIIKKEAIKMYKAYLKTVESDLYKKAIENCDDFETVYKKSLENEGGVT